MIDTPNTTRRRPAVLRSGALLTLAALIAGAGFAPRPALAAAPQGAGQLLKEVPAPSPPAPATSPGLSVERPSAAPTAARATFKVEHIRITGNTLFPTKRLHTLVASGEGKLLSLAEANELAARITHFYQKHGYPLDQAYIPAQTLKDATLTIAVVEARYDKVSLDNRSRVRPSLLKATLAPLRPGAPVAQAPLNRSLLLLNEIPGVASHSTLSPGTSAGTSDLAVTAQALPRVQGSVGLDDYGNRYTGRVRLSAHLAVNNPLHWGDQLNVDGMSSGAELKYGRLGYRSVINGLGTVAGASVSALRYRLGDELGDLGANGSATVGDLLLRQPLVRTASATLDLQLSYDYKRLRDDINSSNLRNDRHINALHLGLSGDYRDPWGATRAGLTLSGGRVDFDNSAARLTDAQGADTRGEYGKLELSLARLQRLTARDSLYIGLNGQVADTNLDPSEQFYLGGPGSVNGYDTGVIGGDEGLQMSAALRHDFALPLPGFWQGRLFVDYGFVCINHDDAFTGGSDQNAARLTSGGIGLDWQGPHGWFADLSLAAPFGSLPSVIGSESRKPRLWAQLQKGF